MLVKVCKPSSRSVSPNFAVAEDASYAANSDGFSIPTTTPESMTNRTTVCLTTLLGLCLLFATATSAYAQGAGGAQEDTISVEYHGELLDEDNEPISGIFPLAFRFYGSEDGDRPAWTERQFVSVHLGEYVVDLGTESPITKQLEGRDVFLAVELESVGEIVRHPFTVNSRTPTGPNAPIIENIETLEFAQVADRALLAERALVADDCERLGGMTVDQLNRYDQLELEIRQLRQQIQTMQTGSTGGGSIGSRTITLEAAGGGGGTPYRYNCPPNHVAVGLSGTAGNLLDSAALICAPLE